MVLRCPRPLPKSASSTVFQFARVTEMGRRRLVLKLSHAKQVLEMTYAAKRGIKDDFTVEMVDSLSVKDDLDGRSGD